MLPACGLSQLFPRQQEVVMLMRLLRLRERSELLLAELSKRYPRTALWFVQDTVKNDLELQGISYSHNGDEIDVLIDILRDDGCVVGAGTQAKLVNKGAISCGRIWCKLRRWRTGFCRHAVCFSMTARSMRGSMDLNRQYVLRDIGRVASILRITLAVSPMR